MTSLFQKKEANKRDLNFFEEYAVASRRLASAYRWSALAAILVVAIVIVYSIVLAVDLKIKQNKIDEYETKFKEPEYVNLKAESEALSSQLERRNSYYYSLTSMRRDVENFIPLDVNVIRLIQDSIPNDTVIQRLDVSGSYMMMTGQSTSYYSPAAMFNLINESEVFSNNPSLTIVREDPEDPSAGAASNNFSNADYEFNIETPVLGQSIVSVSAITNNGEAIGNVYIDNLGSTNSAGISTFTVDNGDVVTIGNPENSISTIEYNGDTYQLSSILINSRALSTNDIQSIIENGYLSRYVNESVDIELQYTEVAEVSQEVA